MIDRTAGAPKNLTEDNAGDDAQPRPSPDGRYLAWTSQARDGYEADEWKLKIKDLRKGGVTEVSLQPDEVGSIVWRRDSKGLIASVTSKARTFLESISGRRQAPPVRRGARRATTSTSRPTAAWCW